MQRHTTSGRGLYETLRKSPDSDHWRHRSLGKVLVRRLLSGEMGLPAKVIVFSRDEAKQHFMRLEYQSGSAPTDEIIYHNFERLLEFRIGDVRDFAQRCARPCAMPTSS